MFSQSLIDGLKSTRFTTKLISGQYYIPVTLFTEGGRIFFEFKYSAPLIQSIKTTFEGRKYHGFIDGDNRKLWSVPITYRNLFRLTVLQGKSAGVDPYGYWNAKIDSYIEKVQQHAQSRGLTPYKHQLQMTASMLCFHWFIAAAGMGTGKTLSAILACELFKQIINDGSTLWVGPKSALVAAQAEFRKWQTRIDPDFITYDSLRRLVESWVPGNPAPRVLILDEASRVKTPTAQRSIAAKWIANAMRKEYGWEGCLIIQMSGTPAPKTPVDWWNLCEIACPGFLAEGDIFALRERLGYVEEKETFEGGGSYKSLKSWKDNPLKCNFCGELKDHPNHKGSSFESMLNAKPDYEPHDFQESINEVAKLSNRMRGLVGVWAKEDCLDLPAKRYEMHELSPSIEILNAAKLIVETSTRAADALIRLRTLSDGFLYQKTETGETTKCIGCGGAGKVIEYYDPDYPDYMLSEAEIQDTARYIYAPCPADQDPVLFDAPIIEKKPITLAERWVECCTCQGKGVLPVYERTVQEVDCPKIPLLHDLLEQHEEDGRFVTYAGFTGSIDRIVKECLKKGWTTLKADGHGWNTTHPNEGSLNWKAEEAVYQFQNGQVDHPRMVFIGQPSSAGMGLTLHASPSIFFYSNDFNPESRQQAEDRGHRLGMLERGGRIIDCIHLPSDRKVVQALVRAKNLQSMSMKGLRELFK